MPIESRRYARSLLVGADVPLLARVDELGAIFENITDGIVVADPEGHVVNMNRAALALHGFETVEEAQRHLHEYPDTFDVSSADGSELPVQAWPLARVLRGERFEGQLVHVRRRDAEAAWIGSYNGTPVLDEQGALVHAVLTIRDVTAQWEAEQALREAKRSAEAAARAREEVLAVVSHDLRSPLTAIGVGLEILRSQLPQEALRHHDLVKRAVDYMERLLQDLLDAARLQQGLALAVKPEPVAVAALLHAVCEAFDDQMADEGITFTCTSVDAGWQVQADSHRVFQVLSNLVSNAIKFTPSGGTITMAARRTDGHILFVVQDTGVGLSTAQQAHVFEPFWQGSGNERRGVGLGLPVAKGLVEAQGGTIWVEDVPDGGSRFCFTLPLVEQEAVPASGG